MPALPVTRNAHTYRNSWIEMIFQQHLCSRQTRHCAQNQQQCDMSLVIAFPRRTRGYLSPRNILRGEEWSDEIGNKHGGLLHRMGRTNACYVRHTLGLCGLRAEIVSGGCHCSVGNQSHAFKVMDDRCSLVTSSLRQRNFCLGGGKEPTGRTSMKNEIFRFVNNLHVWGSVDLGDFACVHPLRLAYTEFG